MNTITTQDAQYRIDKMKERLNEMVELGRMRSNFALAHFVVGQHDTPGAQRAQALTELQVLFFSLSEVQDDIELAELELEDKRVELEYPKGNETRKKLIEMRKIERKLMQLRINIHQRMKEVDYLLELLDRLPQYSAESLEAEEPVRWAARLTRQAFMAQRDPGGNINALLDFITIPGAMKPLTPLSPEVWLKSLGLEIGQIAVGLQHTKLITEDQAVAMVMNEKQQQEEQQRPKLVPPPLPTPRKSTPRKRKRK